MILKQYKNALLDTIKSHGLDPKLFSAQDELIELENYLSIRLRNSPLTFAVRPLVPYFDRFAFRYSSFQQGYPLSSDSEYVSNFAELKLMFGQWLNSAAIPYLDEINAVDLWQTLEESFLGAVPEPKTPEQFEPFTDQEKDQIRSSINELRLSIEKNFSLQRKQLDTTNDLLQYLCDAADKRNRFDWRGIAINVAVTIATHLALNPEQSRQLFELFQAAFSNITHLLP